MQDIVYVIAELDPPHRGHARLVSEVKKQFPASAVVVIMSGNFTQRGMPAVIDRFTRARAALSIGADLVLSLPFPYCTASAESFARGSVSIAAAFASSFPDARHALAFGSECGRVDALASAAERMSSELFRRRLYESGEGGHNARRIFEVYAELYGEDEARRISGPNDSLGIEYVRAIKAARAGIVPFAVLRAGAGHGSYVPEGGFASASLIRSMISDGNFMAAREYMTPDVWKIISEAAGKVGFSSEARLSAILTAILRMKDEAALDDIAECGGGVGRRLCAAALSAAEGDNIVSLAATKQYTNARLRRAALFAAVGVDKNAVTSTPEYTQLLAANMRGISLLRGYCGVLSVVTKFADGLRNENVRAGLLAEAMADRLYTLTFEPTLPADKFLKVSPYISE